MAKQYNSLFYFYYYLYQEFKLLNNKKVFEKHNHVYQLNFGENHLKEKNGDFYKVINKTPVSFIDLNLTKLSETIKKYVFDNRYGFIQDNIIKTKNTKDNLVVESAFSLKELFNHFYFLQNDFNVEAIKENLNFSKEEFYKKIIKEEVLSNKDNVDYFLSKVENENINKDLDYFFNLRTEKNIGYELKKENFHLFQSLNLKEKVLEFEKMNYFLNAIKEEREFFALSSILNKVFTLNYIKDIPVSIDKKILPFNFLIELFVNNNIVPKAVAQYYLIYLKKNYEYINKKINVDKQAIKNIENNIEQYIIENVQEIVLQPNLKEIALKKYLKDQINYFKQYLNKDFVSFKHNLLTSDYLFHLLSKYQLIDINNKEIKKDNCMNYVNEEVKNLLNKYLDNLTISLSLEEESYLKAFFSKFEKQYNFLFDLLKKENDELKYDELKHLLILEVLKTVKHSYFALPFLHFYEREDVEQLLKNNYGLNFKGLLNNRDEKQVQYAKNFIPQVMNVKYLLKEKRYVLEDVILDKENIRNVEFFDNEKNEEIKTLLCLNRKYKNVEHKISVLLLQQYKEQLKQLQDQKNEELILISREDIFCDFITQYLYDLLSFQGSLTSYFKVPFSAIILEEFLSKVKNNTNNKNIYYEYYLLEKENDEKRSALEQTIKAINKKLKSLNIFKHEQVFLNKNEEDFFEQYKKEINDNLCLNKINLNLLRTEIIKNNNLFTNSNHFLKNKIALEKKLDEKICGLIKEEIKDVVSFMQLQKEKYKKVKNISLKDIKNKASLYINFEELITLLKKEENAIKEEMLNATKEFFEENKGGFSKDKTKKYNINNEIKIINKNYDDFIALIYKIKSKNIIDNYIKSYKKEYLKNKTFTVFNDLHNLIEKNNKDNLFLFIKEVFDLFDDFKNITDSIFYIKNIKRNDVSNQYYLEKKINKINDLLRNTFKNNLAFLKKEIYKNNKNYYFYKKIIQGDKIKDNFLINENRFDNLNLFFTFINLMNSNQDLNLILETLKNEFTNDKLNSFKDIKLKISFSFNKNNENVKIKINGLNNKEKYIKNGVFEIKKYLEEEIFFNKKVNPITLKNYNDFYKKDVFKNTTIKNVNDNTIKAVNKNYNIEYISSFNKVLEMFSNAFLKELFNEKSNNYLLNKNKKINKQIEKMESEISIENIMSGSDLFVDFQEKIFNKETLMNLINKHIEEKALNEKLKIKRIINSINLYIKDNLQNLKKEKFVFRGLPYKKSFTDLTQKEVELYLKKYKKYIVDNIVYFSTNSLFHKNFMLLLSQYAYNENKDFKNDNFNYFLNKLVVNKKIKENLSELFLINCNNQKNTKIDIQSLNIAIFIMLLMNKIGKDKDKISHEEISQYFICLMCNAYFYYPYLIKKHYCKSNNNYYRNNYYSNEINNGYVNKSNASLFKYVI